MEIIHKKTPLQTDDLGENEYLIEDLESDPFGIENSQALFDVVNSDFKFIINNKNYDTSLWMFWISICGTQTEAEDYKYSIKIINSSDKRAKELFIFTGERECVSCDVSHEDMMESRNAVFLNKDLLERASYEDDGQKFDYTLVIQKK